jgi:hypothetical protein
MSTLPTPITPHYGIYGHDVYVLDMQLSRGNNYTRNWTNIVSRDFLKQVNGEDKKAGH